MIKDLLHSWKENNRLASGQMINTSKYWQKSPSNILLYPAILSALKKYAKNKVVLDAGAGRLAYRGLITSVAKKYVSFDFQLTHPELDVVTDIENMSFKSGSFDVVFCSQVLEHVPHPWLAMAEIHRILKTKGIAIISVPHLAYLHNLPYDFYRYTEGGLRSLSHYVGFEVISVKPLGGFCCFLGYVRSSMLMPFFPLPILGSIIFGLNNGLSQLEIKVDTIFKTYKLFPLNYLLIIRK